MCNGVAATIYVENGLIVGGPDNGQAFTNILNGTSGDDVIKGTFGGDIINGNGGNDTICGDDGADVINAGTGNDTIFGDQGNDILNGEDDNDKACGGTGSDIINGNNGDDVLCGEEDHDTLNGGDGTDKLDGGANIDTANGDAGTDVCVNSETNNDCEDLVTPVVECQGGGSSSSSSSSTSSTTSSSSAGNSSSASSATSSSAGSATSSSAGNSSSAGGGSSQSSQGTTSSSNGGGGASSSTGGGQGGSGIQGGGITSPETPSGGGGYHGNRTDSIGAAMRFIGHLFGATPQGAFGGRVPVLPFEGYMLPEGGFGGGDDVPLSDAEIAYLCSAKKTLPKNPSVSLRAFVITEASEATGRSPSFIEAAFKNKALCMEEVEEQAAVTPASVPFRIAADGYPITKNVVWNSCIRGEHSTALERRAFAEKDEDGKLLGCSDYRTGSTWRHPNGFTFTWNVFTKQAGLPENVVVVRDPVVASNN